MESSPSVACKERVILWTMQEAPSASLQVHLRLPGRTGAAARSPCKAGRIPRWAGLCSSKGGFHLLEGHKHQRAAPTAHPSTVEQEKYRDAATFEESEEVQNGSMASQPPLSWPPSPFSHRFFHTQSFCL